MKVTIEFNDYYYNFIKEVPIGQPGSPYFMKNPSQIIEICKIFQLPKTSHEYLIYNFVILYHFAVGMTMD